VVAAGGLDTSEACDVALGGYPPPPPGTVPVEYLSPTSGRVPPGYPPPAPGGPPVAWAQPGFGGAPRNAGTDGFAVASLVLGILPGSLLAIIFGIVALGRIRRDGTGGRGLAVAGIVFGCLWPTVVIALAILGGGSSVSQSSADGAVRSAGGTSGAQPTPSTPGSLAPSPAGTPLTELADLPKAVADYRTPLVRAVDPAAREGALEGYRAVYTGPTGEVEIVARGWLSTEAANTWLRDCEAAAPRGASIERGDVLGAKGSAIGRSVLVRDDTAVGHCALAWRNQSTTLALTGPSGGVSAIFGRYPI
jgi:Domain of unknown function (DUF4190)